MLQLLIVFVCVLFSPTISTSATCEDYLVSGAKGIADSQLTASSSRYGYGPEKARLNSTGWIPAYENEQYIQAELNTLSTVYSVVTESPYLLGWTYVSLNYSVDCVNFQTVMNNDSISVYYLYAPQTILPIPITAKCVRICFPYYYSYYYYFSYYYSGVWHYGNALTFDLIGCQLQTSTCDGTNLIDIGMRASNLTKDISVSNNTYIDDSSLSRKWYRAINGTTTYIMVDNETAPLNLGHCNTYYPVYIQGFHPDVNTLTTTAVTAVACVLDEERTCYNRTTIQIRKCGSFIEYLLAPLETNAAYCFNRLGSMNESEYLTLMLGEVSIKPELIHEQMPVKDDILYVPKLLIRCAYTTHDYFYAVDWYIENELVEQFAPSKNIDSLALHEDTLAKHVDSLGFNIHCAVTAYATKNGPRSDIVASLPYFAGAKIHNTTIRLKKEDVATLYFSITLPIGCQHFKKAHAYCEDRIQLFTKNTFKCFQASIITPNEQCASIIQTLKSNETWDANKVFNLTVLTSYMNYDDTKQFTLQLQFPNTMRHMIWQNYLLPDVVIQVQQDQTFEGKICYSHVDPHMRTADGLYYEHQYEGTFMLYWNKKYNIEVQQRTMVCNMYAKCTCALIVRAGKDVFLIDRCGTLNFVGFIRCGDGGILDVVRASDQLFKIYTPIGTIIEVNIGIWDPYMNVDIIMAPKDLGNAEGLCGKFDGDSSNDLMHRDGATSTANGYTYPAFSESWRLTEKDEMNLFTNTHRNLESSSGNGETYCVCDNKEHADSTSAACSKTQYGSCKRTHSVTQQKCKSESRRKRSTQTAYDNEMQRLLNRMRMQPDSTNNKIVKRDVGQNLTDSEATEYCTNKIADSMAITNYQDLSGSENSSEVIRQCAFDIKGGDLTLADVHVEAINQIVKSMIDISPVYTENNQAKVDIFIQSSCPFNCSGRGKCLTSGICNCDVFYKGSDCSIDVRNPLKIDYMEGNGKCDLAAGVDCKCFYVRTNELIDGFTCSVTISTLNLNETAKTENVTVVGEYEDRFTGICCIQSKRRRRATTTAFALQYSVAISNDGINYGNIINVVVFDSTCQNVSDVGSLNIVYLKDGYCYIDGACYLHEKGKQSDTCNICNVTVGTLAWTNVCVTDQQQGSAETTILAVVLGTCGATLLIILSTILVCCLKKKLTVKKRSVSSTDISNILTKQIKTQNKKTFDPNDLFTFVTSATRLEIPTNEPSRDNATFVEDGEL